MSYQVPAPIQFVPIFNSSNYSSLASSVTIGYLVANYLPLAGGLIGGSLLVSSTLTVGSNTTLANTTISSLTLGNTLITATGTQLNYLSGISSLTM